MYKKGRVNSNSRIISTDEDPSLRIESSAIINLREFGVFPFISGFTVCIMSTHNLSVDVAIFTDSQYCM